MSTHVIGANNSIRQTTALLIDAYRKSSNVKHYLLAGKLELCGTPIEWTNKLTGEVRENKEHCGLRACPRCQLRQQRILMRQADVWANELLKANNLRYIFLSIGFKNVPVENARVEQICINRGYPKLYRHRSWPGKGCLTSREFTVRPNASIHFNSHSIIGVEPNYFRGKSYLNQPEWRELIQKAFKLPRLPSVRVSQIQATTQQEELEDLLRRFKYCTKPLPYGDDLPEIGVRLADQLHNMHRLSFAGVFKDARRNCESMD